MNTEILLPKQVAVEPVDGGAMLTEASAAYAIASTLVIDSDDMYAVAAEEVRDIKAKHKSLEERRKGMVGGLNTVVKQINDLFRPALDRLENGESAIKKLMVTYQSEQEAKRREAQRIADQEAATERQRLQAEAAALAAQAKKSGDQDTALRAEAVLEEISYVCPVRVDIAAPTIKGVSTSRPWKCHLPQTEQETIAALSFLVRNPQFLSLVSFNQSEANALAKATKERFPVLGFKAYQDVVISSRS